ncbi:hypothetical protein [Marinobacter sp.]|uniref:DUF7673 family protein n=1 Tax=Marinobacter sp. TaxID=50741 RepID=UPI003A93784D
MITLTATANDIERALQDLHTLAANGEHNDARHAGEFLLALYEGDSYPLNLQDFANLCPTVMRQAMQLLTFLMITGTSLNKFISDEAMEAVRDNLSILRCQGFMAEKVSSFQRPEPPAPPPARLSSCR